MSGMTHAWRHPRPEGAAGRCIGAGTDLPVHWRRAKRLARRIQRFAQRQRLPHIVHCSPLRRCAEVGAWLRAWGWRVQLDPALRELDFGSWDGRGWSDISRGEIDAWTADFFAHAPGGGESLEALLARAAAWQGGALVVTHGGWMLARRWLAEAPPGARPAASEWPTPPRYAQRWAIGEPRRT